METQTVVQVYLEKTAFTFDKPFSYLLPPEMEAQPGCRVLAPFGAGNARRQGMVWAVEQQPAAPGMKSVLELLDDAPVLDERQRELALFLSGRTFTPVFECVRAILPRAMTLLVERQYCLSPSALQGEGEDLSQAQRALLSQLRQAQTSRQLDGLVLAQLAEQNPVMEELLALGQVEQLGVTRRKVGDKTQKMLRLTRQYLEHPEEFSLSPKQKAVAEFLRPMEGAAEGEILYFCGVTSVVLKGLEKKGAAIRYEKRIDRIPKTRPEHYPNPEDIALSPAQEQVFQGLKQLMEDASPQAALLYGVTGSGKTLIYQKLIHHALSQGKQALLLVPEISLTPQMVQRFQSCYGKRVALMHSGLSQGEQLDEYRRVQEGRADIGIGTRSAVFLPFSNLGVIILDEEGEASYKSSDYAPRYHAREVAKFRAAQQNCLVLLGSATPSVESYYFAQKGIYHLFTLKERYTGSVLPQVYLVDQKQELVQGNTGSVSRILAQQIRINLERREQTILLFNRRGYYTVSRCEDCGKAVNCPNCDVPLTYHKDNGRMMCHYCGYSAGPSSHCPSCGSDRLRLSGAGTQKLEEELENLFPSARLLRLDTDATSSRYSLEEALAAFQRQEYDILLGTQMIAKGLDFPQVTLVGVLNADQGLYAPDFRGGERVFDLLTQVVGRSGRAGKPGRAFLQSFQPEHPVVQYGANQDFEGFYREEIAARKLLLYPPFCDLCLLGFSAQKEERVRTGALAMMELLKQSAQSHPGVALKALGPMQKRVYRMQNRYRMQILLKCHNQAPFRRFLRDALELAGKDRRLRGVTVTVDFNGAVEA